MGRDGAISRQFYIQDLDGYIEVELENKGCDESKGGFGESKCSGLPFVLQPETRPLQSSRNDDADLIRRAGSGPPPSRWRAGCSAASQGSHDIPLPTGSPTGTRKICARSLGRGRATMRRDPGEE